MNKDGSSQSSLILMSVLSSYRRIAASVIWRNELDLAEHDVWPQYCQAVALKTQNLRRIRLHLAELCAIPQTQETMSLQRNLQRRIVVLEKLLLELRDDWSRYLSMLHRHMVCKQRWQSIALHHEADAGVLSVGERTLRLRYMFDDLLQYANLSGYKGVRRCVLEAVVSRMQPTQRLLSELFACLPSRDLLLVHRPGSDYLITACEMVLRQMILHVLNNRRIDSSVDALILTAQSHSVSAWQQTFLSVLARHPHYMNLLSPPSSENDEPVESVQTAINRCCQVNTFAYSRVIVIKMCTTRCIIVLHPYTHEVNAPLRTWLKNNTNWDLASQFAVRQNMLPALLRQHYTTSPMYADAFEDMERGAEIDMLNRSVAQCTNFAVGIPRSATSIVLVDQGASLVTHSFAWHNFSSSPVTLAWMWALWLRKQHLTPQTILLTSAQSLQEQHTTRWHLWSLFQLLEADPHQQATMMWRRQLPLRPGHSPSEKRTWAHLHRLSQRLLEKEEAYIAHRDITTRFQQMVSYVDITDDESVYSPVALESNRRCIKYDTPTAFSTHSAHSSTILVPMSDRRQAIYKRTLETHRKRYPDCTESERFTSPASPLCVERGWGTALRFQDDDFAKFEAMSLLMHRFSDSKHLIFSYCRRNSFARESLLYWLTLQQQKQQHHVWNIVLIEHLVQDWLSDVCQVAWTEYRVEQTWVQFMTQRWIHMLRNNSDQRPCFILYGWNKVDDIRSCDELLRKTPFAGSVMAKDFVTLQQHLFNHPLNDDGAIIRAIFADPRFVLSLRVQRVFHVHELEPPSSVGLRELVLSTVRFQCSDFSAERQTTYDDDDGEDASKRLLSFHTYITVLNSRANVQEPTNEEWVWNQRILPALAKQESSDVEVSTNSNDNSTPTPLHLLQQVSIDREFHLLRDCDEQHTRIRVYGPTSWLRIYCDPQGTRVRFMFATDFCMGTMGPTRCVYLDATSITAINDNSSVMGHEHQWMEMYPSDAERAWLLVSTQHDVGEASTTLRTVVQACLDVICGSAQERSIMWWYRQLYAEEEQHDDSYKHIWQDLVQAQEALPPVHRVFVRHVLSLIAQPRQQQFEQMVALRSECKSISYACRTARDNVLRRVLMMHEDENVASE